ncbi:MAG: Spi family protease inhibitor [Muribaculaceae bacterium]|nr:Spi family protease inhibitor [Muribaculaceae bacterium]
MKKSFFFAVLAVIFASCAGDAPELRVADEGSSSPKTNLEYALAYAEELMGQLDPQTRGVNREVADIQFVCNDMTRSGEQDTTLYLVNYADNMGFALLDAQAKNGGVYAISPKGHLEFSDSVNNPVLAHFFRRVREVSANHEPLTRDGGPIVSGWKNTIYQIEDSANPILCSQYADWTYNDIPGVTNNGGSANITTAACALAKILAYYLHPEIVGDENINWKYISRTSPLKSEVYKLLRALNTRAILQDYVADSSGHDDWTRKITPEYVDNALKILGLGAPSLWINGDENPFSSIKHTANIKLFLSARSHEYATFKRPTFPSPLIAFSMPLQKSISLEDTTYLRHPIYRYWIIDGFQSITKYAADEDGNPIMSLNTTTLYNCIWGNDYYMNGYYAITNAGFNNMLADFDGNEIVYEELSDQFLFPETGIIGGYNLIPEAQPN